MNRRARSVPRSATLFDSYQRFLKPGALARLRDSRISTAARSSSDNRLSSLTAIPCPPSSHWPSSSSSPPLPASPGGNRAQIDNITPCFSGRSYGVRCPQRKKLVAARSIYFVPPSSLVATSASVDASDSAAMEMFGTGIAAH